jgi:ABC-2 type transport system permease protein
MTEIYVLSLRQLTGKWRLLVLLGLALLPLVTAAVAAGSSDPPTASELDDVLLDGLLASAVLPIVALAVGTAAFGNELEDKTLGNLTLAPLSRSRIVLPKLAAVLTVCVPFLVASSVASVLLGFSGAGVEGAGEAALAAGVAFAIGSAAYGAVFLWAGLVTSHPLGFGLVYVFVWEGLFGTFVDGIKYLSIRQYTLGLVAAIDDRRFTGLDQDVVGAAAAVVGVAIVIGAFVPLAVRRLRTMDVQ